ncbi:glutathione hydrolase 1 proenzyme-like isoform X2 [Aedes albopictus]|uniref:Gamma-glutamyltransferase n=1 Tax=Aedes albopictus TaxID=7160 RepID=A0ABM1ZVU8_AEDAL
MIWLTSKRLHVFCIGSLFAIVMMYFQNSSPITQNLESSRLLVPPNPRRTDTKVVPSYTPLHVFKHAAVCSDSEICSGVGRDILQRNGSVVDATLATMFCAGLSNMQSMGIGGGFIMNIYIKNDNAAYTLDAREITAMAAAEDMHLHDPSTTNEGPLSIATPGELKGYWEAHKRFGKLQWKEVLEPTLNICRNGFEMSKHMFDSLHVNPNIKQDIGLSFGAALSGKRTGIIVNSGMDDFSSPGLQNYFGLPGSKRNYIQPQKRALSSMSPTIVVDNH